MRIQYLRNWRTWGGRRGGIIVTETAVVYWQKGVPKLKRYYTLREWLESSEPSLAHSYIGTKQARALLAHIKQLLSEQAEGY